MLKREAKRWIKKFEFYAEPLLIAFFLFIVCTAIASVNNLKPTPINETNQKNVLGATTDQSFTIVPIGGTHNYITSETLQRINLDVDSYSATIIARTAGRYNKPILDLINNTEDEKTVTIILSAKCAQSTEIGVISDVTNYVLRDSHGNTYTKSFTLLPRQKITLLLSAKNSFNVNFNEEITLTLKNK